MSRDLSKYLHHLDEYDDLSPTQKLQVAQAVWALVEHLCDQAMRMDATQLALGITGAFDSPAESDPVESEDDFTHEFRRTAGEAAGADVT